jgi:hypothetical protein
MNKKLLREEESCFGLYIVSDLLNFRDPFFVIVYRMDLDHSLKIFDRVVFVILFLELS